MPWWTWYFLGRAIREDAPTISDRQFLWNSFLWIKRVVYFIVMVFILRLLVSGVVGVLVISLFLLFLHKDPTVFTNKTTYDGAGPFSCYTYPMKYYDEFRYCWENFHIQPHRYYDERDTKG